MRRQIVDCARQEWHPNDRPDVVVRIRSFRGSAVITSDPPQVPDLEGVHLQDATWRSATERILGVLCIWLCSLREPCCVVLELDDPRAAATLEGGSTGSLDPAERRLRDRVDIEQLLGGHDLRRHGDPRPIMSDAAVVYLLEDRPLVVDDARVGIA